jgi:Universal stress protein family
MSRQDAWGRTDEGGEWGGGAAQRRFGAAFPTLVRGCPVRYSLIMFETVVVGADESPAAAEAVRQAIELVKLTGGKLHIVSA